MASQSEVASEFFMRERQSSKHQHPSSREAPTSKLQTAEAQVLELEIWSFSGAWSLEFGASLLHQLQHRRRHRRDAGLDRRLGHGREERRVERRQRLAGALAV